MSHHSDEVAAFPPEGKEQHPEQHTPAPEEHVEHEPLQQSEPAPVGNQPMEEEDEEEEDVQKEQPPGKQKPQGILKVMCMVYMILGFISFAFLLTAACPIPWYRGTGSFTGWKWNTWRRTAPGQPDEHFNDIVCAREKHYRQVIATCAVLSAIFSFFNLLSIAACTVGKGRYGLTLMWGFFTIVWSIGGWAMSVALFHSPRCNLGSLASISHLDAGFALTFIAWVLTSVSVILLMQATRKTYGPPPSAPPTRAIDVIFFIAVLISLLFLCVGCAFTMWKRTFPAGNALGVKNVKVTMWTTTMESESGRVTYFGRRSYRCPAYTKRIKATASFTILGIIFLFFAGIGAIMAFLKPVYRVVANVLTAIVIIFIFIAWVTAVAVRYRTLCVEPTTFGHFADYPGLPSGIDHGYMRFEGYTVAEGLGLIIAAWCILLVALIANIAVGAPAAKAPSKL